MTLILIGAAFIAGGVLYVVRFGADHYTDNAFPEPPAARPGIIESIPFFFVGLGPAMLLLGAGLYCFDEAKNEVKEYWATRSGDSEN